MDYLALPCRCSCSLHISWLLFLIYIYLFMVYVPYKNTLWILLYLVLIIFVKGITPIIIIIWEVHSQFIIICFYYPDGLFSVFSVKLYSH